MNLILKFLLLIEAFLLAGVIYLGLEADSAQSTNLHASIGIASAIYTLFIHCLALFYLIGSHRAIKQVVTGIPEFEQEYIPLIRRMKKRMFPLATFALIAILIASFAGGWVHSEILAARNPSAQFPVRAVPGWWLHLALLFPALFINLWAFLREIQVVGENVGAIEQLNRKLAESLPAGK
ncbi:MAG: hypothetical protein HY717_16345 [Planctomycetes bacterium]|nr:hypothetical protein [Planctomycetota bacterium]